MTSLNHVHPKHKDETTSLKAQINCKSWSLERGKKRQIYKVTTQKIANLWSGLKRVSVGGSRGLIIESSSFSSTANCVKP